MQSYQKKRQSNDYLFQKQEPQTASGLKIQARKRLNKI